MFERLMRKIVQMIDPKLEKYRPRKPVISESLKPKKAPEYVPKTLEDFIGVIQRTPIDILSARDRARIAAVMSFEDKKVKDLMAEKEKIVFVKKNEVLGPLMLDRLYKSGFTSFPVIDEKEKVIGIIHTEALNALEIKKTEKAEKYMDKKVNYIREDDSLEAVLIEIEQTDCCYFLVHDKDERLTGCFTIQMLLGYLVG